MVTQIRKGRQTVSGYKRPYAIGIDFTDASESFSYVELFKDKKAYRTEQFSNTTKCHTQAQRDHVYQTYQYCRNGGGATASLTCFDDSPEEDPDMIELITCG